MNAYLTSTDKAQLGGISQRRQDAKSPRLASTCLAIQLLADTYLQDIHRKNVR